jgi:transcriptional regulator with XRE-family HTH domain
MPAMDVARRFGENLRRCRRRAGFSQEELGMRSSLHRTEIGLLERGARVPRIDTLIKISSALRIPPVELIEGIEWAPGNTVSGAFRIAPKGDPQSN